MKISFFFKFLFFILFNFIFYYVHHGCTICKSIDSFLGTNFEIPVHFVLPAWSRGLKFSYSTSKCSKNFLFSINSLTIIRETWKIFAVELWLLQKMTHYKNWIKKMDKGIRFLDTSCISNLDYLYIILKYFAEYLTWVYLLTWYQNFALDSKMWGKFESKLHLC